jgi:hypothetical protein
LSLAQQAVSSVGTSIMTPTINTAITANVAALAAQFAANRPFRHVVMDDFFDDFYCQNLLDQFPHFDTGNARTENGDVGLKSTVEKIRDLGPAYLDLDELVQSRAFLSLIGRITSIPELRYDPWYFGGGTHENRHGQDLDTHIDFNRHPINHWHRRLNLIVYLNPEWQDDWGGALRLHADPRAEKDEIKSIAPLFNRAVLFETTEKSWHSFPEIRLPEHRRSLSRKSIAFYFYSEQRPPDELADTHSTIYVDRPLPDRFRAGFTLAESDVQELRILMARRDHHIQRLYRDGTSLTTQLERAKQVLASSQEPAPRNAGSSWRRAARMALNRLRR